MSSQIISHEPPLSRKPPPPPPLRVQLLIRPIDVSDNAIQRLLLHHSPALVGMPPPHRVLVRLADALARRAVRDVQDVVRAGGGRPGEGAAET